MPVPRFIYPQHPKTGIQIAPHQLDDYDALGNWFANLKFQGSNAVIWVYNDQLMMWNRQGQPFVSYKITDHMRECFRNLDLERDTEYVFNGELLHAKAVQQSTGKQAQTNTIVLFDLLFAGHYMVKETIEERQKLLWDICRKPKDLEPQKQGLMVIRVNESQLWLAENFASEFKYHFWRFVEEDDQGNDRYPLIEGLLLKQRGSKNVGLGTKPTDVTWMVRCRKTKEKMFTL